MMLSPPSLLHRDYETDEEERRRRTMARDLAGTELTLIEASLVGLGGGALWAAGTGEKLLRRTIMSPLLPESMEYACLAGAVTGALAATGLWAAWHSLRESDAVLAAFLGWAAPLRSEAETLRRVRLRHCHR
jgi:hypothetical protein